LDGIGKASVVILANEVNGGAAPLLVLIEELIAADGDVVIGPFQLRSGALQLLTADFEEGGKVGVLGVVELLGREGNKR